MGFFNKLAGIAGGVGGFMLGGPAGAMAGYGLANGLTSGGDSGTPTAPGGNLADEYAKAMASQRTGAGAQDALNTSTKAAVDAAMPSFRGQLQGVRENAIARGAWTGDLGTSYEGDLASAFDAHTKSAVASQAAGMYNEGQNRYLDLLTGGMDRQTQDQNYQRQRKAGLWGSLGSALGAAWGYKNGGMAGAGTGAGVGGAIGTGIGGY
jgi:hypothetical protein